METLNRQRVSALQEHGIQCHLLYLQSGSGLQNTPPCPTYVTNEDHEIQQLISVENYDAVIVASNYLLLQRIRRLGYENILIYEVQGLGNKETADRVLKEAYPYVTHYANASLFPRTSHLIHLFHQYYESLPKFCFHNCIDTDQFWYKPPPQQQPSPVLGWIGRIEPNKNWRDFLLIGSQLIQINPQIKLWIFEDEHISLEKAQFEQAVHQLNLSAHLVRHSNVPHQHMVNYLSMIGDSGGFLCSTSITEGFGYAIIEAMCCRCPVLATDSDGVRSFITHNVTGKFYSHGNIQEAVNEALQLMSNPSLRDGIRQQAQAHIQAHFSKKQYRHNFISMLTELGCQ